MVWRPPPSVTHSPETPMGGGRERCKRRREEPALLRTPLRRPALKEQRGVSVQVGGDGEQRGGGG